MSFSEIVCGKLLSLYNYVNDIIMIAKLFPEKSILIKYFRAFKHLNDNFE